ncbi:MAG: hypothetical protein IT259_05660 [Saprospiraceae bacterium]|nr:hypothetical protein [Saprospiraceae bacterium]
MNAIEKYWEEVARLIADEQGGEPPHNWNKFKIDAFLRSFHTRLEQICRADPQKAALCGVDGVKGGDVQSPRLSYFSFRRIFITRESTGNRSTREMFAIYLGFESVSDFLNQKSIIGDAAQAELVEENTPTAAAAPKRRRLAALSGLVILVAIFWIYKACRPEKINADTSRPRPFLFVRNENGIAIVDPIANTSWQIVRTQTVIGIDFDPVSRQLFWANGHDAYRCLSSARLDPDLKTIEKGSFKGRLTGQIKYPAGIALDPVRKRIYCADHYDSTIVVFDYEGRVLIPSLVGKINGRPSSVELDVQNQVLYWTDVINHKIGRIFLDSGRQEPEFIAEPGLYPDGLSLDTLHRGIYWACNKANRIGWTSLDNPAPHFTPLPISPAAVEVDALRGTLYYCDWESDLIRKARIDGAGLFPDSLSAHTLNAQGASPGVVKLFYLAY